MAMLPKMTQKSQFLPFMPANIWVADDKNYVMGGGYNLGIIEKSWRRDEWYTKI